MSLIKELEFAENQGRHVKNILSILNKYNYKNINLVQLKHIIDDYEYYHIVKKISFADYIIREYNILNIKLNYEIIKFWEDEGYIITHNAISKVFSATSKMLDINIAFGYGSILNHITVASYKTLPINYFWNNEFHSEKNMLRLIKLKAFW